jgi:pimeloyl-ACP methyl ester carboxylesterase
MRPHITPHRADEKGLSPVCDNMAQIQDMKFSELGLQKYTSSKKVVSYHQDLDRANSKNPILVLLHGYPNSAYLYANLIDTAHSLLI